MKELNCERANLCQVIANHPILNLSFFSVDIAIMELQVLTLAYPYKSLNHNCFRLRLASVKGHGSCREVLDWTLPVVQLLVGFGFSSLRRAKSMSYLSCPSDFPSLKEPPRILWQVGCFCFPTP